VTNFAAKVQKIIELTSIAKFFLCEKPQKFKLEIAVLSYFPFAILHLEKIVKEREKKGK